MECEDKLEIKLYINIDDWGRQSETKAGNVCANDTGN
jgi:hypothetical protein